MFGLFSLMLLSDILVQVGLFHAWGYDVNSQKKKQNWMDCNNYGGISLLSTPNKILLNILLSRMTPYANDIIGEYVALGGID